MSVMDHWHPVLLARNLRDKPVGVCLNGHEIVLFRSGANQIGALEDRCPHRRMRLSQGEVVGQRLQCKYHGWCFNAEGEGESPGTPKLTTCAKHYDAQERHGAIWVKSADSQPKFPTFDVGGHYHVCTLYHRAKAPLEVTLDNFCEVEHTATTHALFGFPLERMQEVQVRFETTDSSVRSINHGPPKPLPWALRTMLGVGKNYQFNDDWTTYFSPVHSVYQHWWSDPITGKESRVRWKMYIFFTPINDDETAVVSFTFTRSSYPGPNGGVRLFKWLMVPMLSHEIDLDVDILDNLADKNPAIDGMKLSRFDRILGLNRERIQKVYRGRQLPVVDVPRPEVEMA
jgi:phenylpropionate dioxygenase-like ring-hydroxylating dioxygenase large terminal subunit